MSEIKEELGEIRAHLAEIKVDLKHHIKRTELLEERFEPVEDHVKFIRQLMKTITWLAGTSVAVLTLIKLIKG